METKPAAQLSEVPAERKAKPMVRGLLDYFPAALAAVSEVSRVGNEQHNPGAEMHHARGKSMDHADCIVRHLVDRGVVDSDGLRHSAKVAWRALALLQEELEAAGAPLARAAKVAPIQKQSAPVAAATAAAERRGCEWWIGTSKDFCTEPKQPGLTSYCAYHAACSAKGELWAGPAPKAEPIQKQSVPAEVEPSRETRFCGRCRHIFATVAGYLAHVCHEPKTPEFRHG